MDRHAKGMFEDLTILSREQRAALDRLVEDGVLAGDQASAVRQALAVAPARRAGPGWFVEVAGYVGGGLMLAGVAAFLGTSWDLLSEALRTGVLALLALAFSLAGVLVAGGPQRIRRLVHEESPARRRVVGVLFALASVATSLAVGVAVDRYEVVIGALAGFAVAAAAMVLLPSAVGLVATVAFSVIAVVAFDGEVLDVAPVTVGLHLIVLGLIWASVALARLVSPWQLALVAGTGLGLVGAQLQLLTESTELRGYTITFGLSVACFLTYRWQRSVVLLAAGVIGVTLAVPEAVDHFAGDTLGTAVILLVAGAVLVAASALGLRLRRSNHDRQVSAPGRA